MSSFVELSVQVFRSIRNPSRVNDSTLFPQYLATFSRTIILPTFCGLRFSEIFTVVAEFPNTFKHCSKWSPSLKCKSSEFRWWRVNESLARTLHQSAARPTAVKSWIFRCCKMSMMQSAFKLLIVVGHCVSVILSCGNE